MAISAATAVGWVAAPVMKSIWDNTLSYLSSQYNFSSEINGDLQILYRKLDKIRLSLSLVKRPELLDPTQQGYLRHVIELAEEAEELLDEFDYLVLKDEVDRKRQIKFFVASSVKRTKRLLGYHAMKLKLKALLKVIDTMDAPLDTFLAVIKGTACTDSGAVTEIEQIQGVCSHSELIGREKESDMVINKLINMKVNRLSVVSIVGKGGVGKTALAQLVNHDKRIESHFDIKAWITLAGNLDLVKYTKEILKYIDTEINMDDMNTSLLQFILQKELEEKKLLLVLDNVWDEDALSNYMNSNQWTIFLEPLRRATSPVVILVTTRMMSVASMIKSDAIVELESLSAVDSILLFESCAFGNRNAENYPQLREFGKRYLYRFNGYPLAIKVIGSLLSSKMDFDSWKEILVQMDLTRDLDIMAVLRLSYDRLPSHLKRCFQYCSLFPKNFIFGPEVLPALWISQGYVEATDDQAGLQKTASSYFEQLVARSFFQSIKDKDNATTYVMHDLCVDLSVHVSMGEYLTVEGNMCPNISHLVQHLYITDAALVKMENEHVLRRLKTLVVVPFASHEIEDNIPDYTCALKKMRSIRALVLVDNPVCKLPNTFDKFMHLRFLWLYNMAHQLPNSIDRLYHLQILWLACSQKQLSGVIFPRGIKHLTNILNITVCGYPVDLSHGRHPAIHGHLGYDFSNRGESFPCMLGCKLRTNDRWSADWIEDMNFLSGALCIAVPKNIVSIDEATKLKMSNKRNINALALQWELAVELKDAHGILAAVKPSHNLITLIIDSYPGAIFPSWLGSSQFEKLTSIELVACINCKKLPPFGNLPGLNYLLVTGLISLVKIGPEFYGSLGFPKLICLQLYSCIEIKEICCPDQLEEVFPNLNFLALHQCNKLVKVPFWRHFRWSCRVSASTTVWTMEPVGDHNYEYDEVMISPLGLLTEEDRIEFRSRSTQILVHNITRVNKVIIDEDFQDVQRPSSVKFQLSSGLKGVIGR